MYRPMLELPGGGGGHLGGDKTYITHPVMVFSGPLGGCQFQPSPQ